MQKTITSTISFLFLSAPMALPLQASESYLHELTHLFEPANIVSGPEIVECKLSNKATTDCFKITVKAEPKSYTPGPWCPTNVTDGPDKSGIWLENGKVYDADGKFMSELANLYSDKKWQMVDPDTGEIKVTDSLKKCSEAARPDVGVEYENYCVECLPEYLSENATTTYTIPITPQDTLIGNNNRISGSGVAINGIRLDAPAPVDAILGAYTVAPFDDCGGHINLHAGYHYHAATDCLSSVANDQNSHAKIIGIAMDGYKIMSNKLNDGSIPDDLDRCYGHKSDDSGYHYHAGAEGSNAILGCLSAAYGSMSSDPLAKCDASVRPSRPEALK